MAEVSPAAGDGLVSFPPSGYSWTMARNTIRTRGDVDWGPYPDMDFGVESLLAEVAPSETKEVRASYLEHRKDRLWALKVLLSSHDVELTGSEESLRELNEWFVRNVDRSAEDAARLAPIWYSVVNDIALYLGELMIRKTGTLEWIAEVDKEVLSPLDSSFVDQDEAPGLVIGRRRGQSVESRMALDELIAGYGHAVITGHHVDPDYFLDLLLAGVAAG